MKDKDINKNTKETNQKSNHKNKDKKQDVQPVTLRHSHEHARVDDYKNKKHLLRKVASLALVFGLLGGVVAYGGSSYIGSHTSFMSNSPVPSSSNKSGYITKSNTKNVQNQSETAFKSVRPAVVSVLNMQKIQTNPLAALLGDNSKKSNSLQTASEGSGVIYKVHGNSAYLVTNNHVVNNSKKIKVILSNGKKVPAKVVGTNKSDDLAVVKINSKGVTKVASFGNSNHIQAGETSLAIGSPLGATYASTLTQGIISDKNRKISKIKNNKKMGYTHVIQTDTAINPGNSGGALINLNGQVIGINSAKVATDGQGTSVQGMGFAIPSNKVTTDINQIISKAK